MKIKESKVMEEIHKIREKHYEETKNMSCKERVDLTKKVSEKILRELNLTHSR
jgi:shikimate kinase